MNKGPFAVILMLLFVWTLGGAGELFAAGPGTSPNKDLSDIPSTGEFVAMGVAAAAVIGIIVILIVSSGDDEDAGGAEEVDVSGIEETARPERVDPVLILGRDTLGAGLTLSF